MSDPSLTRQFESVADDFARQIREGTDPRIQEYASRYPELAEQIYRLFPILEAMERAGEPADDLSEEGLLQAEMEQLSKLPALRRLGDYRIVREIGRGGMGIVFEAQQESLGRRVALKLLPKSARFDERRQVRFEQEARASAMLHHTNIVPVFGVGTEGDHAYFVMQYIDGQPLDGVLNALSEIRSSNIKPPSAASDPSRPQEPDRPDDNEVVSRIAAALDDLMAWNDVSSSVDLTDNKNPSDVSRNESTSSDPFDVSFASTPSANATSGSSITSLTGNSESGSSTYFRNVAKFGIQIASGLQYAHSKKILHRDIKPSNILVDLSGCVWITDFGLAKYFESPDLTRTGEVVGTLRYMSPEQLNGKADERSDIFSLGLTLYEMAGLKAAYSAEDKSKLLQQVLEAAPVPLRSIDRRIPRDLETIIHKCIASDPRKRYQSAEAIVVDLQRFLAGEPVLARRTSPVERIVKWCRRRPAVATLLTALAASLIVGVAGIAWQLQKTADALELAEANLGEAKRQTLVAQDHFQQARESVNRFFTIVSQQRLLREPGFQPLRRELLQEALDYHTQFVEQYRGDNDLQLDLAKSLFQIAEIEGSLSGTPKIIESLNEPKNIFSQLAMARPEDPEPRLWLARTLGMQGKLMRRVDSVEAMNLLQAAIDEFETIREDFPESSVGMDDLAKHYQMIGLAYETADSATQRTDRCLECYSRSLDLYTSLLLSTPNDINLALSVASVNRDLGITYRRMGDFAQTEKHYDQAMAILEPIVAENPNSMPARTTLASIANSIGFYYGTGKSEKDYARALEFYAVSREQYENLAAENPLVVEYQDGVARAALNVGAIQQVRGDLESALANRQFAADVRAKLVAQNPDASYLRSSWAISLNGVGSTLRDLGRYAESMEKHKLAHEQHLLVVEQDPTQPMVRMRLIDGRIQIARTHIAAQEFQQAADVVNSIDEFALPSFSKQHILKAVEFTSIACKLGEISEEQSPGEFVALHDECIATAKKAFEDAAAAELDVLRELKTNDSFRAYQKYPEGKLLTNWLESEFNSN